MLKLEDTNVKAMWRKAQALRGKGDFDDAKDAIVKAIRLDAKNKCACSLSLCLALVVSACACVRLFLHVSNTSSVAR